MRLGSSGSWIISQVTLALICRRHLPGLELFEDIYFFHCDILPSAIRQGANQSDFWKNPFHQYAWMKIYYQQLKEEILDDNFLFDEPLIDWKALMCWIQFTLHTPNNEAPSQLQKNEEKERDLHRLRVLFCSSWAQTSIHIAVNQRQLFCPWLHHEKRIRNVGGFK